MATEVDICNMALAYLGDRATVSSINPPEGSAQADHCARFYPIARAQLLSEYPWAFALKRTKLAKLATPVATEGNSFTLPQDCVRLVSVHAVGAPEVDSILDYDFESFNGYVIINCQAEEIFVKYVSSTTAESMFTPVFADTLAHLLASKLAGSLVPGTSGIKLAQEELKLYRAFVAEAIKQDASQIYERDAYRSPFVGDMVQEA